MMFDWVQTAQGGAVIGGGLVGLAAALLLILTGRSMNLSDMLGSLLGGNEGPAAANIAFLAGLVLAPTLWQLWAPAPAAEDAGSLTLVLVAGSLAGFGARLGGTGISGHVILGLARPSKRALVAVVCLFLGGALGAAAIGWFSAVTVPT